MKSGKTLWEEICLHYYRGADQVNEMKKIWSSMQGKINNEQFAEVSSLLEIQHKEAIWWRNACVLYFQTFSKRPIPASLPQPEHDLAYYEKLEFPFAPGIRPRW
jgi:alpha-glucuronidase